MDSEETTRWDVGAHTALSPTSRAGEQIYLSWAQWPHGPVLVPYAALCVGLVLLMTSCV